MEIEAVMLTAMYDDALIGVANSTLAVCGVYSYDKLIEIRKNSGEDEETAKAKIDELVSGLCLLNSPVIVYNFTET